jgi:hypothetical protein
VAALEVAKRVGEGLGGFLVLGGRRFLDWDWFRFRRGIADGFARGLRLGRRRGVWLRFTNGFGDRLWRGL